MKRSMEDFMGIVEGGQNKTASARKVGSSLLEKLANELAMEGGEAAATTTASVQAVAAGKTGVEAAPGVVAATDAVTAAQLAAVGMDPAQQIAGEVPAQAVAAPVVVSAMDGTAVGAADGKTQEASAAAAAGFSTTPSEIKTASDADALGRQMARSFHSELSKIAQDNEYQDGLMFLKQAGMLDGYKLADADRLEKIASAEGSFETLEKIASMSGAITKADIITGAQELVAFQKLAADAEAAGRAHAHELMAKVAEEEAAISEAAAEGAAEEGEEQLSEDDMAALAAQLKAAGYKIVKE
jgi:hypothetical protein